MQPLRTLIAAKLLEKGARNLSDAELDRCLGGCVAPTALLREAKLMREDGVVSTDLVELADPQAVPLIEIIDRMGHAEQVQEEMACSTCSGSGEGMADGASCWACKGIGSLTILTDEYPEDDGDAAYDHWKDEERGA